MTEIPCIIPAAACAEYSTQVCTRSPILERPTHGPCPCPTPTFTTSSSKSRRCTSVFARPARCSPQAQLLFQTYVSSSSPVYRCETWPPTLYGNSSASFRSGTHRIGHILISNNATFMESTYPAPRNAQSTVTPPSLSTVSNPFTVAITILDY